MTLECQIKSLTLLRRKDWSGLVTWYAKTIPERFYQEDDNQSDGVTDLRQDTK